MRPNKVLVAILSAATVTGGVFVGSASQAQPCPLSSKLTSINSIGTPGPLNSNSIGTAAGISLLGGLLVVGGVYLSRRRQSDSVTDEAEYESELPSVPVAEQVSERELVGSRK